MRILNENLLDDTGPLDLSIAQNVPTIYLGHVMAYSIQLVFNGSPAGTFKLQASNDLGNINSTNDTFQTAVVNWTDIADSSITVSAAGNCMWQVEDAGYAWVRVVWTPTSGTGSLLTARAMTKGV